MFLTGGLRHFVSESGEMRGWDDVCVYVCVLELSPVSSGGSSGSLTVNRSSWASANPLAGVCALYHSVIFYFTYTQTHTRQAGK